MLNTRFFWSAFLLLGLLSLQACEPGTQVRPISYGKVDHLLVVSNDYLWESAVGDSLRRHFEALYPVTPQPEGIFDLRHEKAESLDKVLRTRRCILVLADLKDTADASTRLVFQALGADALAKAEKEETFRIAFQKDRWAENQLVVYWFAPGIPKLLQTVQRDYKKIIERIQEEENKQLLQQVYFSGENEELSQAVRQQFGFELKMPKGYVIAHQDSAAMWMRYETDKISSNVFIAILPDTLISKPYLRRRRDELTRKYFATHIEDSYMQIDDRFIPTLYQDFAIQDMKGLQARGIWHMVNDFMGGPFVTYLFRDTANQRLILLDGFAHAPGEPKRPEMRKLDAILGSFKR